MATQHRIFPVLTHRTTWGCPRMTGGGKNKGPICLASAHTSSPSPTSGAAASTNSNLRARMAECRQPAWDGSLYHSRIEQ
eukprot:16034-Hanusia_phi.AAC.2